MTTDYTLLAIKQLIDNSSAVDFPNINGINVFISQEDDSRSYPCVTIMDTGSEEHETLRGVFDPLSVDVTLQTIPNDTAADGTTQELHRDMSNELYNLLGDSNAIIALNDYPGLKVFDIRGIEQGNDREDGRNAMTLSLEITCCQTTI